MEREKHGTKWFLKFNLAHCVSWQRYTQSNPLLAITCSTTIHLWAHLLIGPDTALKLPCQDKHCTWWRSSQHSWGSPVAPDPPPPPSNMDTNQEATNCSQIRRWTKSTSWPEVKSRDSCFNEDMNQTIRISQDQI